VTIELVTQNIVERHIMRKNPNAVSLHTNMMEI